MDRRYYGLKALILVVGLAAAIVSSLFGAGLSTTAQVHYSAAHSVQASVVQVTTQVSHAVGHFIHNRACWVPF